MGLMLSIMTIYKVLYLKILRTARSNLLLPTDKMEIGACTHTRVALMIMLLCIYLAVCLSEITTSENVVLYSVCIAIIFQYSYSTRCVYLLLDFIQHF